MADIETNVNINIDTSDALAQLKLLQQQISAFQQAMRKAGADNAAAARAMQQNLVNSVNATGKFQANIQTIQTSAERFTTALEKNKLTMGEYFRYAGGASKSFGKLFKSEFETINQVARERVKELQTQYIKLGRDANGAMKAIAVKPLALDMDNLGTKTQIAAQRQQLFNQLMKQGSTQLLNFGKNTQWAGRQLMVGFTVPLTMMGSAAAKAYMEIEKASISFQRVYGDMNTTTDEANKMAKAVRGLANEFTKYGVAVSDTMDMAAKAAAMGKTGADLLTQITEANKLAVLGNVEQQQALETTMSLTNAFGTSTEDLSKKIDFLNAVENQTVTSIEDLTVAIPKAAPVIKQLGGNVEDLSFFLTAMKEGGINASEGANALKSGLASMINPTKKASDFLAGFGINVKGIVEKDKGNVRATVIDMAKAFDTLDPLNRARAIEQMFGKFQFSRISTLFQNVIKEGSQAQTVAELSKQTAEELAVLSEREMKKISDSPMYKFQKSIQDIQAKLAPVGEAFLKAVTPIVEFVGKVLDGFNNLSEGSKQFITVLVTAVAGIGPLLLMTFGLISNGIANIMKLFTNIKAFINKTTKPSDILGEQTTYMTTEQLKGAAIAASLDQAHAKLRQTFTSEAAAVNQLTEAYRNAVQAQQAYSGIPGVPVGNPNAKPKKYAQGVSYVPGPKGAGDIVPALLSPGEAVIPAKHAQKYAPVIAGMVAGNLPGFESGTTGAGMRQSVYGPLTQKQTEGLARTGLQLKEISDEVLAGPYANVPPTDFGTQISPTTGHSFPAFSVGGIYQKPDGTRVFVKPQMDLTSALAEVRGTTIAREAHGLIAPKQTIRVMMDPTDPDGLRRFLVLESAVDPRIAEIPTTFTKDQYFKQLVASLLRGDKDLGVGNLGGDVLADVGTAGVFGRASGKRALGSKINSMEEQAIINLLGVKGGAKRFFAEATAEIAKSMTPEQYDAEMKAEIRRVIPKLDATIAGMTDLTPEETQAYADMVRRLGAGLGVDWTKYHQMHSAVTPKKYGLGTSKVPPTDWAKLVPPEILAMMPMLKSQTERAHLEEELDKFNPNIASQVQKRTGLTPQKLQDFQVLGNLTADIPAWMNQYMRGSSTGIPAPLYLAAWNAIRGKMNSTAEASVDDNGNRFSSGVSPIVQQIEDQIGQLSAASPIVKDSNVSRATRAILERFAAMSGPAGELARGLMRRAGLVGDMRFKRNQGMSADEQIRAGMERGDYFSTGREIRVAGSKIKVGEVRATAKRGTSSRTEQERAIEEYLKGGDYSNPPVSIKGASLPPGTFGERYTGTVSYQETEPRWSAIADFDVFDKNKFAPKHGYKVGAGGFELFKNAQKFAEGTDNVGKLKSGKPKASIFDIDDTLLNLSAFMPGHQAANEKLPKDQRKDWYKEVAKNPQPIPAGIRALEAAQARGNKIILMTARPESYDAHTRETLAKLGVNLAGVKIIARKDKDYRKPEQMKYEITKAYQQWYDIEEFYDDMDKTRGAISLLGIPTHNPLKLAGGVFSVPGPKGAGDVVPAMLTPGEAVIPADKAEKHRGLIANMIAGNVPGYNKGTSGVPGYSKGIPGVPKPKEVVEESKPASLFAKAVDKLKDAAEAIATPLANVLNADNKTMTNRKGKVVNKDVVDKIKAEKDADEKLRIARLERTRAHLEANNEEYAQLKRESDLYREEKLAGKQHSKAEQAQQSARTKKMSNMENAQIKEWDANGGKGEPGTGKGGFLKKMFTATEGTGKVVGRMMGATTAVGLATQVPGVVGDAAKAVMGPLSAATTAMSMIPGPAGLVAGALAAGFVIYNQINEALQKMRDEAYKTTMALGAGNKAIGQFAEFAKKATGTEVMDKQRAASAGQFFNVVPGKTTFGESYMKTDAGKELVKNVGTAIKNGDLSMAEDQITQQLSTAIGAGVMTPAQARSIAANLGKSLKNANFGINVAGKLTDVFGPDGADLKRNPLETRMRISKESLNLFTTSMDAASEKVNQAAGTWDIWGKVAEAGGAVAASYQSMLESQQQMVDSLEVDYQKRIAAAMAAKDITEATRLENQYLIDRQAILEQNKQDRITAQSTLAGMDSGVIATAKDTAINAVVENYKGTGQEGDAAIAQDLIKNKFYGQTDIQKMNLAQAVASKQIGLTQVTQAQNLFGQDAEGSSQLDTLLTNLGGTEANRAIGITQNMGAEEGKKFLIDMSLKNPEQAKEALDALEIAQKTTGPFAGDTVTQKAIIDFSVKNADKLVDTKKKIDSLKKLSGNKITLALEAGKLGKDVADAIKKDVKRFNKYNDANKIVYTTELRQIMEMYGNPAMMKSFRLWQQEVGGPKSTFADFASYQADRTVQTQGVDNTTGPGAQKQKEVKTPEPSVLDPYVKMLREANLWQQKLTVGWNDSYKAIMKYGTKAISTMSGIAVMMKNAGAATEEINAFMNGTEEEQNRIIDKKTGKLKKDAGELLKKLKEIREASEIGLKYVLMTPAERLAKDNELYQAGLEVIGIKEKEINDKYDKRIKALDEIGKIQERNNQQQQDTLSLADAISKGDIAAAARAALTAKQNDQKQAMDDARTSLENARKQELADIEVIINGHVEHRETLEKSIADNAEKIAGFKLKEAQHQHDIEQNALKSAKHIAQMLKDGKALSLLKPYNPVKPGKQGGQEDVVQPGKTALGNTQKVGLDSKGNTVANQYAQIQNGSAGGWMSMAGMTSAWDFKKKKFVMVKRDENANKDGYVQDEKTPGTWVLQTKSNNVNNQTTFATEAAAKKNLPSTSEVKWTYDAMANVGYWEQVVSADGAVNNPIKLPSAKGSNAGGWNEEKLSKGSYYIVPAGAFVYGVSKDGANYKILYGKKNPGWLSPGATTASTGTAFKAADAITDAVSDSWTVTTGTGISANTAYPTHLRPTYRFAMGGVVPQRFELGGGIFGTDTVPAMLTPGEFVVKKSAVDAIGVDNLKAMNSGASMGDCVYNYSVTVNANSSDASGIADAVMREIKRIDSQRIRSSVVNG
jgi:TP901 family phage tail tape measure protein